MKNILKYISLGLAVVMVLVACQKYTEDLPYYETGKGSDLTLSANTVSITAANAGQNVLTFNWTDPQFAVDTAHNKYVIEIAPKGTNFANPYLITKTGTLGGTATITGTELNNALVAWGIPFGTLTDFDVRLKSSYLNNNDMKISPVQTIKISSYSIPITLNATANGPFTPTPQTKDNILTVLSWNAPNYGASTLTYTLEYAKAGTNFANAKTITIAKDSLQKSLTALELYQMANNTGIALNTTGSVDVRVKAVVDGSGQTTYSTTQVLRISPVDMTLYLYVAGGFQAADPYKKYLPAGNTWGWDPATAPTLASTDGINYEGYIWVPAGVDAGFKFVNGPDWSFGDHGGSSGESITVDGKSYPGGHLNSGSNLMWPATGKYYLVKVNMNDKTWTAMEINWGIAGSAPPAPYNWDNAMPMTYDITLGKFGKWKVNATFTAGEIKFKGNNSWDYNLGIDPGNVPYLGYGKDNIPITAGAKTVTLDLSNPMKYTYTIQ